MTGSLEPLIAEWRTHVSRGNGVREQEVEELEAHLRDQIKDLGAVGLSDDEAFMVAVKRLGDVDQLSREFATADSSRLWRQFVVADKEESSSGDGPLQAILLGVLAAIAVQIPQILQFGPSATDSFYLRNATLLVLPFLAWYFVRKRGSPPSQITVLAVPFVVSALVMNLYPWDFDSNTEVLAAIHLPVVLWFAVGYAYMGGNWASHQSRMNFVRFTGEWVIYYVLIALGGGVLLGLTAFLLEPAGPEVVEAVFAWVLPSGAAGAALIAAWLVEEKQAVVENMAPVLTMIFTPLFALMLTASAIFYAVAGLWSEFDREAIFALDVLPIVVLGLILYGMSARDSSKGPGLMDRIQLVAVVAALALDLMILFSMLSRVGELGTTPNRVAAIGLNVVLLANLVWAAWLSARFVSNRVPFHALEHWQTSYLPVFPIWAAAVVAVLPVLMQFA